MGRQAKDRSQNKFKKLFSSDAYNRNLDRMKLLVSDERFQNKVLEARKLLHLPETGFLITNDKGVARWAKWLEKMSDEILDSVDFNNDLKNIQGRLKKKIISHPKARMLTKKLDNTVPINYWHNIGEIIAVNFNMGKHFDKHIQQYILFNCVSAPSHNYSPGFYQAWERPSHARYIPINIYTQLTKDEWNELKNYVDMLAEDKLSKSGRIPNIDKYIEVEEKYKSSGKYTVHDDEDYFITQSDMAEELFHDSSKASKVRDMVRKLENLRRDKLIPKLRGEK